jgi:KDO2-lipid IV(A) lauroyltransferase
LRTRLWQRAVLGVLVGGTGAVQRLSRPAAMRLGVGLGRLAYRVARRQRRVAERNLRLAYGDALTAGQRDALVRRVFEQFGKTTIDFLRAPALGDAGMNGLVATVEGREWLEATRAGGRGFIIVTGHIGNFELLGRWLAAQGVPSTAVARDPADPALAQYARRMREVRGNVMLSKGTSARELLARLGRGEVITLGVDQNSGDVFVPFFGVPAGTVTGPAKLALHRGAALLPAFCLREPDDRYQMLFLPPITAETTGDREADVARMTAEVNRVLESVVRRFPDQWLWLHNRWKSAFEEDNRPRWPEGTDFEAARRRWQGE